jgi:hypothetical protein
MRKMQILLAGVAVAAAGAATSAFTAGNTVNESVAGYAAAEVSGATATKITYVLDGTDKSLADGVNFEISENITGMQAFLTLRDGGASGSVVGGGAITCSIGARTTGATPVSPITCVLPDIPLVDFDSIGLTVAQ